MSIVGLALNLLLAGLLVAALGMGWRLNRRLKALRDSHDGFAVAVRELNSAAARAEQGLADLRAATDEAIDLLADRIDKGRSVAAKLERLIDHAAAPQRQAAPTADPVAERRLGALLAAAREARPERVAPSERLALTQRPAPPQRSAPPLRRSVEDDLFDDEPLTLNDVRGAAR
ncbi:DUF6468 domain-containing protein [Phenylobacterium sp.]|jgi:hypothetical protein|uniref:DUF6468 domain-containing protein n=1 Tax=Phenylobacterium sp. TaxID=1871053 RepID=UPI002E32F4F3|nr:DUF6468 domain-containing protein [Phenylobacterium sp.]HEX4710976.1 DUF6468 domain-containing protein [Phenylobacterium sp.]